MVVFVIQITIQTTAEHLLKGQATYDSYLYLIFESHFLSQFCLQHMSGPAGDVIIKHPTRHHQYTATTSWPSQSDHQLPAKRKQPSKHSRICARR